MSFRDYFSPTCETRELHADPQLRTRYYRNKFEEVVEALHKLGEKNNFEVRDVNKIHKEIYVIGRGFDSIVTVAMINPIEAGIDFKLNLFATMGFGRPKKMVVKFYADLKQILRFKGISLHP